MVLQKIYWEPCIYLCIHLVHGGAVICGPLVSGQRQTCWLLGCWETPLALISEKETGKTEGGREAKKKKKKVWMRDRGEEWGNQREKRSRETDGWITAFTSLSYLFARKAATHFPSLSSSQSCHPLVISQHKIQRISPGQAAAAKRC